MANRAGDWLNQARHDVAQAEDSRRAGCHEWACFAAQQAADKAVKTLHLHLASASGRADDLDPTSRWYRMVSQEPIWVLGG